VGVEIAKHGDQLLLRGKMDGLARLIRGAGITILLPALNPRLVMRIQKGSPFIVIEKIKEGK